MFAWSKILGLASVVVATGLLGMVAFDVPYFKSVYFLRIDLGNGTATTASANQTSPFVDLGALGFCTDLKDSNGLQCSPPHIGYSLSEASQFLNGTLPPALAAAVVTVSSALTKVLVLHIVAFGIALVSLAFALLAFIGIPIVDRCSSCFCGFAGAAAFAVFVFDIAFFEIIKLRVNQEGHPGTAIMGNAVYLTLLAWLFLFVTPIMFLIGRCCACCMLRK
ncbi:hypothetical protein DFH08DRAFT_865963 [Mycena albidolilacea]|uniref:Pali-domain-containing protein n=1 Tax=Mycena albidolilacea TaxID=1033008 RepID=A0AAD7ERH5_9AGAR|nr:hypothetical protein DFH08DRAFT_865963 [Mycena albidolilacea]